MSKLNGEKEKMKKDIQGLRKEIVERDDTIQDKVSLLAHLLLIKCTQENVDIMKYIFVEMS